MRNHFKLIMLVEQYQEYALCNDIFFKLPNYELIT